MFISPSEFEQIRIHFLPNIARSFLMFHVTFRLYKVKMQESDYGFSNKVCPDFFFLLRQAIRKEIYVFDVKFL